MAPPTLNLQYHVNNMLVVLSVVELTTLLSYAVWAVTCSHPIGADECGDLRPCGGNLCSLHQGTTTQWVLGNKHPGVGRYKTFIGM